jgi:arabinofuranosyltransferase
MTGEAAVQERRVLLLAGIAGLGLAGVLASRVAGRALDDIYVTYRYARNLADGLGFVFNPGERVFGVTDPGVGLLLAAAHALTGIAVPLLGTLLTGLALWICTAVLAGSGARGGRLPEALAAGLLLLTAGYLWTAQGSGPLPALALLLVAAWLAEGPGGMRPVLAGLAAGAAVWCRPDAALGALLLGLLLLLERGASWAGERDGPRGKLLSAGGLPARGRAVALYAAGLAAAVLPGVLAARLYFGTVIPNTLGAKQQAGALRGIGWDEGWAGIAGFWGSAWGLFRFHAGPLAGVLVLLALAGLPALWRRGGLPGRLLVLHGLGIAVAYSLLGVPFFLWYTVPPAAALLAAAAWGAGALIRRVFSLPGSFSGMAARRRGNVLAAAAVGAGAALLLGSVALASYRWWRQPGAGDWRLPAYRAAGMWIRDHAPPDAEVALEEIGIVGYFGQRPVRDLIGLVTPASLPFAAQGDLLGAFLVRPSELVVFHTFTRRGGTRPIVGRPWFARAYEEAARIELPEQGGSVSIYRRRPGARVPPPRPPRSRPAAARPRPSVVS